MVGGSLGVRVRRAPEQKVGAGQSEPVTGFAVDDEGSSGLFDGLGRVAPGKVYGGQRGACLPFEHAVTDPSGERDGLVGPRAARSYRPRRRWLATSPTRTSVAVPELVEPAHGQVRQGEGCHRGADLDHVQRTLTGAPVVGVEHLEFVAVHHAVVDQ
jgi:hypothetical protein